MKELRFILSIIFFIFLVQKGFAQEKSELEKRMEYEAELRGLVLNGEKKPVTFGNRWFGTSISTILALNGKINSKKEKDMSLGSARVLLGFRKDMIETHFDLDFQSGREKWQLVNPNLLKQAFFQINFERSKLNLPFQFRFGKFRTAAAILIPYSYNEVLVKGHNFGSPFMGLYGTGFQAEITLIKTNSLWRNEKGLKPASIKLLLDYTLNTQKYIGNKPRYTSYEAEEVSAAIIADIPKYHVITKFATQISLNNLFTRVGSSLNWYNPNDGWAFLNLNFFYERNYIRNFINFSATTGLRLFNDLWEIHTQVESGERFWREKDIYMTYGTTFKIYNKETRYWVMIDYETPIEERVPSDWKLNVNLRIFTDFHY